MTLVELALVLALIVFALAYLCWDVHVTFRRQERAWQRSRWMEKTPAHTEAWEAFQAEVAVRRLELADALAQPGALDRLAALVDDVRVETVA